MRIFNEDKTIELKYEDLDFTKGYLKEDVLITHFPEIKPVPEEGHYEVIAEYETGGKDVEWIIDVPGVPGVEEHDEKEDILVYILFNEQELKDIKRQELEAELSSTDYKAIKYAEGWYSDEEYAPIKAKREELREQIRALES